MDDDILDAAAETSDALPEQTPESQQERRTWVESLDVTDKNELLCRVADGDANVQWELTRRFRQHIERTGIRPVADSGQVRPISSILAGRDKRVAQREQEQAQAAERRKRQQQAVRRAYLEGLSGREDTFRSKINTLIGTVQQNKYDNAVRFLVDLRDAAALRGDTEAFDEYVSGLRNKHARKSSLIRKFDNAGLYPTAS